eukprot:TRINITY_DN7452_c0_g1_i1.p1 TRINITY_DN7452_c0_g1~~TRINITY_DN7452_c0_g1_i1.p1  ORF type:complete len:288 (+),score=63.20 TRINITY_DN7452_c0_g1_i1:99-962(+)
MNESSSSGAYAACTTVEVDACYSSYAACEAGATFQEICQCVETLGTCLQTHNCESTSSWEKYNTYCFTYFCPCGASWSSRVAVLFLIFACGLIFSCFWLFFAVCVRRRLQRATHAPPDSQRLLEEEGPPPILSPKPCSACESISIDADGDPAAPTADTEMERKLDGGGRKHNTLKGICKVCMTNRINVVLIPCGHNLLCLECSQRMRVCAICRTKIDMVVRTFGDEDDEEEDGKSEGSSVGSAGSAFLDDGDLRPEPDITALAAAVAAAVLHEHMDAASCTNDASDA